MQLINEYKLSGYLWRIEIIRWSGILDVCDCGDLIVGIRSCIEKRSVGCEKEGSVGWRKQGGGMKEGGEVGRRAFRCQRRKEEWMKREKEQDTVGRWVGHLLISIIIRISFWVFIWVIFCRALRFPFKLPCYLLLLPLFFYRSSFEAKTSLFIAIMLEYDQIEIKSSAEWREGKRVGGQKRGRIGCYSGHTLEQTYA